MSIGRDSFWTPAHLAIQLGGIIGGTSGAVLDARRRRSARSAALRGASIGVLGFRGPFGAFLAAWGAATMVVSAPFDNWWHSAYGLDVKILSPPHAVLLARHPRRRGRRRRCSSSRRSIARAAAARRRLAWILLVDRRRGARADDDRDPRAHVPLEPPSRRCVPRRSRSSRRSCWWRSRASCRCAGRRRSIAGALHDVHDRRWLWLFPLFSAEPKLGPVYQPITHFVPLEFPLAADRAGDRDRSRARAARAPAALAAGDRCSASLFVGDASSPSSGRSRSSCMTDARAQLRCSARDYLAVLHAARLVRAAPRVHSTTTRSCAASSRRSCRGRVSSVRSASCSATRCGRCKR